MDDKSDDNKGKKNDLLWCWWHVMTVMTRYDSDEELWWWLHVMMVTTHYDSDDTLW